MDVDGDGTLTGEELGAFLAANMPAPPRRGVLEVEPAAADGSRSSQEQQQQQLQVPCIPNLPYTSISAPLF